jgi:hypothetical protein
MKAVVPQNPFFSLLRWLWPLPVLTGLVLLLTGCAGGGSSVTIKPVNADRAFARSFEQSYVSRKTDGSYDVVLVHDDAVKLASVAAGGKAGRPLQPAAAMPLRQVVHIRVMWRPMIGTETDSPSATNASIDWYVLGGGTERWTDLLHYGGAGFVTVDHHGDTRRVTIRNATLKPRASQGGLADPLGTAKLTGSLVARRDPRRVRELLLETRDAITAVEAIAAAAASHAAPD